MTTAINWAAPADLFSSIASTKMQNARYRRFSSTAEAIRFAIEQLPHSALRSVAIESGDDRYQGEAIRALYDAPDFPRERDTR